MSGLNLRLGSSQLPPLDSHRAMSPQYVTESMRMSQAENLWRYMHSESYPEPQLSDPRSRTHTMSIPSLSSLTQRANQRLEVSRPSEGGLTKSLSIEHFSPATGRWPTDSDFKHAIDKLSRVYAQGGVDSKKVTLQEGKNHEFMLDAEEKMFAKVNLLGSPCPMVLSITRTRGRLVSYISKTVQEPMEMVCDAKITNDRIWLSDNGVRFKSNLLYITFLALEDSTFTATLQFGQKKRIIREKWKSETMGTGDDEWERLFGVIEDHRPKFEKNFVTLNRRVLRVDSPENLQLQMHKLFTVDARRKEAAKRKREELAKKKKRALELLNRQQLKEQERQKQLRIAQEKAAIEAIKQKWLVLVWCSKSVEGFLQGFSQRKAAIAEQKRKDTAARKIQRMYRRHVHFSNEQQLALQRGWLSFRLVFHHICLLDRPIQWDKLYRIMKISAKFASVPIQILQFHEKSKCYVVVLIQTTWRHVQERHKQLLEELMALWAQTLSNVISAANKKKPAAPRGKKAKESPSVRYINITSTMRNQLMLAHFLAAKKKLKADCRAYVQARKNGEQGLVVPRFQCIPTAEEMLKIVEKAADSALQVAE